MPSLSRDPEHLRIPAFMRTRELSKKTKKKNDEMIALDRKEKGVLPQGVSKKTARTPARPGNMWEIAVARIHKEKHPEARVIPQLRSRTPRTRKKSEMSFEEAAQTVSPQQYTHQAYTQPTFQMPQQQAYSQPQHEQYYRPDRETRLSHNNHYAPTQQGPVARALKAVGEITEFFNKINVAVLRLDDELSVGDTITYQTVDGSHTQTVLSMEINRKPIFKASRGDEVGIKLYKIALVGKVVYAQGA